MHPVSRGERRKYGAAGLASILLLIPPVASRAQQGEDAGRTSARAALAKYCVTCHNASLKTGGIVIDPSNLDPSGNAALWERVIRQLRAKSMPPVGVPRPDRPTYEKVASYLETEIDRSAAANPNPGELPNLHRLTRTEYGNAVRDLLGLDNLPKEMDYTLLLPADNSASGFDNIADLLYVSPVVMERYLDTAGKISRMAVGDPSMPVMVNILPLPLEQPQNTHVEGLPLGTRGGIAVRSYFPLNAEYEIQVELAGNIHDPQQLELDVDGERKGLLSLGPAGRGGRGGNAPTQFRIPIAAGPRFIGVTFVQHTEALDEATLHPHQRSRGVQPAIASVTIRGPYNSTGPGDTPSRQRIFTCYPKSTADEAPCAKEIVSTLMRRAYRRPITDSDLAKILPFYEKGRAGAPEPAGFERGIQTAARTPAGESAIPLSHRARPRRR